MNRLDIRKGSVPKSLAMLISFLLAAACVPVGGPVVPAVNMSVQPHLSPPQPCENRFVAHTLDHITTIEGEVVPTYDSNGAHLTLPSPVGAGLVPALDRAAPPPN